MAKDDAVLSKTSVAKCLTTQIYSFLANITGLHTLLHKNQPSIVQVEETA